ncbi:MAG: pilus assembly protein PilX [Proteobacteria bacterium]|nr:pilus assembly protein PilX [Pseudomonadota bacterium]MDE3208129.1 pilus assembly protein PilX [Pseudomonadota bacterium]
MTLFIALIALVTMTLAVIALIRSVDTANTIAGNMAFRQAAREVSDTGIEAAYSALPNILATSEEADIPNEYFATMQPVDANGVPTTVNWQNVPSTNESGYAVQYIIERLCNGPLPVTDIQTQCLSDPNGANGSNKAGAIVFSSSNRIYYRVTVRVTGPRNTMSMAQAILSF